MKKVRYNGGGWITNGTNLANKFKMTVGKTYDVIRDSGDDYYLADDNDETFYLESKYFTVCKGPLRVYAKHKIEGELIIPWGGGHPRLDGNDLSKLLYDKGLDGKNIIITIEVLDYD